MTLSQLRRKSDIHIERKLWHFIGVLLIIIAYNLLNRSFQVIAISFLAFSTIAFDFIRLKVPALNKIAISSMHIFMRESERNKLAGTTYLLAATWIIVLFFDSHIVNLSLGFLAVADPMASLIGVLYGKTKLISGKSLQGTLTAFLCCFLISYFYFQLIPINTTTYGTSLWAALACGVVGALSELIPIGNIDDNFTLPIISALFLWALFNILPTYGI